LTRGVVVDADVEDVDRAAWEMETAGRVDVDAAGYVDDAANGEGETNRGGGKAEEEDV
jgi:hypothetical protein